MRKFLSFISVCIWALLITGQSNTIYAESTTEETSQENVTIEPMEIPDQDTWSDYEPKEQVQWIVKYVYLENQAGRPVSLSLIEDLIGSPDETLDNHSEVDNLIYYLHVEDYYDLELKLAVLKEEEQVLEALGILNYVTQETEAVTMDTFKATGEVLKENYQNKVHSQFEDIEDLLGFPKKISYLYDMEILHYPGEHDYEEIALSQTEDRILALNYLNQDPKRLEQAIPAEKRDLDLISHTSGYTWQNMVTKFDQPMGINYNSEQGIIGLSWYSEAEDSVGEVYFYMGYDEIPIGTTYR